MREGDTPKRCIPKGLGWPLHREKKNKRGFMGWVGVEGVCGRGLIVEYLWYKILKIECAKFGHDQTKAYRWVDFATTHYI